MNRQEAIEKLNAIVKNFYGAASWNGKEAAMIVVEAIKVLNQLGAFDSEQSVGPQAGHDQPG